MDTQALVECLAFYLRKEVDAYSSGVSRPSALLLSQSHESKGTSQVERIPGQVASGDRKCRYNALRAALAAPFSCPSLSLSLARVTINRSRIGER